MKLNARDNLLPNDEEFLPSLANAITEGFFLDFRWLIMRKTQNFYFADKVPT